MTAFGLSICMVPFGTGKRQREKGKRVNHLGICNSFPSGAYRLCKKSAQCPRNGGFPSTEEAEGNSGGWMGGRADLHAPRSGHLCALGEVSRCAGPMGRLARPSNPRYSLPPPRRLGNRRSLGSPPRRRTFFTVSKVADYFGRQLATCRRGLAVSGRVCAMWGKVCPGLIESGTSGESESTHGAQVASPGRQPWDRDWKGAQA